MRKLLFLLVFSFTISGLSADSIQYLNRVDTIFLEIGVFKSKTFKHTIAPSQTLYSLAKFYGLTVDGLLQYNPEIEDNVVSIEQKINIPIPNKAIIRYKDEDFDHYGHVPIYYIVKPGDSLYGIAKRVFRMPVEIVKERNGLTSDIISIGQKLLVGWMSINGIPEEFQQARLTPDARRNLLIKQQFLTAKGGRKEYQQSGPAFWQKNSSMQAGNYALHNKARINSQIVVSNPMMGKKVLLTVIGRIPGAVYPSDVIVVVSPSIAKKLGAKDPRFFTKVKYYR